MLTIVRLALRISGTTFDNEIQSWIDDCLAELTMLGIYRDELANDKQIQGAVILYVKWKFGYNNEAEKFGKLYKDKVEKLLVASNYGNYVEEEDDE